MTLRTSKCSRYNIDQRLTVDAPTETHRPLQHGLNTQGQNGVDCIGHRIVLTNSSNPLPSTPASPRSIFAAYWKTNHRPSSISPRSSPVGEPERIRRQQQQRQQQRRQIHQPKTYSYFHNQDPFEYFGIAEAQDNSKTQLHDDTDDSSINSYERVLRQEEAASSIAIHERSSTYPCFSAIDIRSMGTLLVSTKKTTQSDTILFAKASSLQRSCLRKGRFSCCNNRKSKRENQLQPSKEATPRASKVSFESVVEIQWFEIPAEKWAPNGWSSWFGA